MKWSKKLISFLLVLAMVLSWTPVTARAVNATDSISDEEMAQMLDAYYATGTTGDAEMDGLLAKYQNYGTTGNSYLDTLIDRNRLPASGTCGALSWNLTAAGVLTISGSGDMTISSDTGAPWSAYLDRIRKVVIGDGVTSIGYGAFQGCANLTEVTIPNTVTTIEGYAFCVCEKLTEVTIPASVTSIGSDVFSGCSSLKRIQVDGANQVYSSDDTGVLFSKDGTELIQAPGSISGFYEIPAGVTSIGVGAFGACLNLISVVIPEGVTTINAGTFAGCSGLKSVTIPAGVTEVQPYSFYGCTDLDEIRFLGDAPVIGEGAFTEVAAAYAYYPAGNSTWTAEVKQSYGGTITWYSTNVAVVNQGTCGENVNWVLTEDGVLTVSGTGPMDDYTWDNDMPWALYWSRMTRVRICEGVTSIGNHAFRSRNINSITIADSVTRIGHYALAYNSQLTSVAIPDSVTTIDVTAFFQCENLTTIRVPASVSSIGLMAFGACRRLERIVVDEENPYFCSDDRGVLFSKDMSLLIQAPHLIGSEYTVPSGVEEIGMYAFENAEFLLSVEISEGVTCIGDGAFAYCYNLNTVTLPSTLTDVQYAAFRQCIDLDEVVFKGDAPRFSNYVFQDATTVAYYPSGNTTWTDDVMQDYGGTVFWTSDEHTAGERMTENLVASTCTTPGSMDIVISCTHCGMVIGEKHVIIPCHNYVRDVCTDCGRARPYADGTIYQHDSQGNETGAMNWELYADGLLTIHTDGPMFDYSYSSGPIWWNDDYRIRRVEIQSGVTHIGDYSFYEMENIVSVTIADTVTSIGDAAFFGCTSLNAVSIPGGVTDIGVIAFAQCDALTALTIPQSVTAIGKQAFYDCGSLNSVTFEGDAPAFGEDVFENGNVRVLYPCGNDTWTEAVMQDYGGSITWTASHNYVDNVCTRCADALPIASGECGAQGDNLTWVLTGDGVLTISGTGAMGNYVASVVPWVQYRDQVKEIVLEPGVTTIGDYAFYSCGDLKTVTIADSVVKIGNCAFYNCVALTEITIPGSVKTLGAHIFYRCPQLTTVVLEEGITAIGETMFSGCLKLTDVTIPGTVKTIGVDAFKTCESLTSVTIPAGVESIGDRAFSYCKVLTSVTFEGNAPAIGENAFLDRTLTVYYPCSGETWTEDVMQQYGGTVTWAASHNYVDNVCTRCADALPIASGECGAEGDNLTWVLSADGKLTISGEGVMADYTNTNAAPWSAYKTSITSVAVESGVTTIGNRAFEQLTEVTAMSLPAGLTTIGNYAFCYCELLEELAIPASVTSIGNYAFGYCASLTRMDLPAGLTALSDSLFTSCSKLAQVTIPDSVTTIGSSVFRLCRALTDITIPERVTTIKDGAFRSCSGLTGITIPGSVTTLGKNVFAGTGLTEAVIPETVTTMGIGMFDNCYHLVRVTLPQHMTSIPESMFNQCNALESITIPENVTSIGNAAFNFCNSLTEIEIPSGVTSIGNKAFYGCSKLTSIEFPESVTSLGHSVLCECAGLTSVKLPSTITSIPNSFLGLCTSLTSVELPETVTTIGVCSFMDCKKLTSITLPDGLETISEYAFKNCYALSGIEIPASVETVGDYAFGNCYGLKTITFMGDKPTVGGNAFQDVVATAYYPAESDWVDYLPQNYGGVLTWMTKAHEHTPGEAVEENGISATCTAEGSYDTVVYCTECGEEVSRDTKVIEKLPHTGVTVPGTDATCVAPGLTDGRKCSVCGEILTAQEEIPATGEHTYVDGICTGCGAAEEITYDMSVAGANMSLGSELAVNFFVKKVDIDTSKDYYIQVTKTYADGRADVTKTYYFQKGEWMDYNSTYYGVKFNGVAAKEMADKLYVQVFHADGTPASDVWTDSIRDYAMRMFGKGTNEKKTMYVDMLNYGAAAQTEFGYGTDDLANSKLTAEHQAYATQTIAYANNRVEGENYYGTNLNLGSSIALNMYFQNVSQDMYAIATYTDHYGNEKEVRIEGSAFVLNKASTNGYRISINTLAVADVRQLVTCTVYNTDGTVVGTCTDSVEGYIARKANSSALYDAIMRFATSAYNSFHPEAALSPEEKDRNLVAQVKDGLQQRYEAIQGTGDTSFDDGLAAVVLTKDGAYASSDDQFAKDAMAAAFGADWQTSTRLSYTNWLSAGVTSEALQYFNTTADEDLKNIYNGTNQPSFKNEIEDLFLQLEDTATEIGSRLSSANGATLVSDAAGVITDHYCTAGDFADAWASTNWDPDALVNANTDALVGSFTKGAMANAHAVKARNTILANYLQKKGYPAAMCTVFANWTELQDDGVTHNEVPMDVATLLVHGDPSDPAYYAIANDMIAAAGGDQTVLVNLLDDINGYFASPEARTDGMAYYGIMDMLQTLEVDKDDATYWDNMQGAIHCYARIARGEVTLEQLLSIYDNVPRGAVVVIMMLRNGELVFEVDPSDAA